jgi:hypothetical protein
MEVLDFFLANKRRPTQKDLPNLDKWLQKRGKSVNEYCGELGLYGTRNMKRTFESVASEIQEFARTNGRPPKRDDPGMPALDKWLQRKGSSLAHYRIKVLQCQDSSVSDKD